MSRLSKYPPKLIERGVRQAEADSGKRRDLLTSQERAEIKKLCREVFELRRANEIQVSERVSAKEFDPDRTK
jgi:transposase